MLSNEHLDIIIKTWHKPYEMYSDRYMHFEYIHIDEKGCIPAGAFRIL